MRVRNIMVPFDRSEQAQRALRTAVETALPDPDAQVFVVSITPSIARIIAEYSSIESSSMYEPVRVGAETADIDDLQKETDDAELEKARAIADPIIAPLEGRATLVAVGNGSPATGIVSFAESHGIDLIIMGSRGLGALRGILGSVSYAVLRASSCPVMIVK